MSSKISVLRSREGDSCADENLDLSSQLFCETHEYFVIVIIRSVFEVQGVAWTISHNDALLNLAIPKRELTSTSKHSNSKLNNFLSVDFRLRTLYPDVKRVIEIDVRVGTGES